MESILTKQPGLFLKGHWRGLAVLAGLALAATLAVWLLVSPKPAATPSQPPRDSASLSEAAFEEATGVRITHVAITGQGGLIDFRYQVIDPDKAVIVHDADKPPTLVAEANGQVIDRPWMQHGHSGKLNPGATYYLILVNPKGGVKSGDSVSVIIGDFRLEHLIVK